MDDRAQNQSDPSATRIQTPRKRKAPRAAQPEQPDLTRQVTAPQPILFPEVAIEILTEIEPSPPSRPPRFPKTRRFLRSRTGRILIPLLALLIGLAAGFGSILWYGLSATGAVVLIPKSAQGNLIIEADQNFVAQLVRNDMATAGLPGQVKNVTTTLAHGDALTIQGDDVYSLLGLSLSRHFVINVEPYVKSCALQARVTHADLGGIPVTGFVQSFEGKINQQLGKKPVGLPTGFAYCTASVRTEPGAMFITYQAIPLNQ